jgi:mRNA-degrading endonuclease RelE of RelBE toxin-antitoxin system
VINYQNSNEFNRDLKKLLKKFSTLLEDIEVVKKYLIEPFHLKNEDRKGIFLIPGFCDESIQVLKIKKFACKALKGRGAQSGIRIIYSFIKETETIEFIEVYFKSDQENENKDRIKNYLNHKL